MANTFVQKARYGKANVRVMKRRIDPSNPQRQDVIELRVRCLLEGDLDTSYTQADNTVVVPTDTVKNTIYILAQQGDVWPIELFGARLADHFINKYSHIHGVHIDIEQIRWTRYNVNGKPHDHSFIKEGNELRTMNLYKHEGRPFEITSGIKNLTVLKSTGSMFYDFHTCDFTTLKDTSDRILSTDIDATWKFSGTVASNLAAVTTAAKNNLFDDAYNAARGTTLERFALENSASVQATMYNMSCDILAKFPALDSVSYALPNKHYFEIDLSWHHGTKNTGPDARVYAPQSDPNGHIECTVAQTHNRL